VPQMRHLERKNSRIIKERLPQMRHFPAPKPQILCSVGKTPPTRIGRAAPAGPEERSKQTDRRRATSQPVIAFTPSLAIGRAFRDAGLDLRMVRARAAAIPPRRPFWRGSDGRVVVHGFDPLQHALGNPLQLRIGQFRIASRWTFVATPPQFDRFQTGMTKNRRQFLPFSKRTARLWPFLRRKTGKYV
jgi:hypothetical protein